MRANCGGHSLYPQSSRFCQEVLIVKQSTRVLAGLVISCAAVLTTMVLYSPATHAQGTLSDYQRAQGLREKFQGLAVDIPGQAVWIGDTGHFWYKKSVKGGSEFILVDVQALTKKPAFDHEKLAAALSSASGEKYTALTLP